MDQQGQNPPTGPGGRRLHIAHRRSPSEMTPLMMEQLALAQQIEMLQQQQQQVAAAHQQFVSMGMIQPQQQLPTQTYSQVQGHLSPPTNNFQFPQQQFAQQQMGMPMQHQSPAHRRNQSAIPSVVGPPPAPSTGAGMAFSDFNNAGQKSENVNPRGRGGGNAGSGHARRHSLALPEAKKAAEIAESKRKNSSFQFPVPTTDGSSPSASNRSLSPSAAEAQAQNTSSQGGLRVNAAGRGGAHGRSQSMAVGGAGRGGGRGGPVGFQFPQPGMESNQSDLNRRGSQSGHGRTQSRNFDGNWRQPQQQGQDPQSQPMGSFQMNHHAGAQPFQPGHRNRNSMSHQSVSSIGSFQFPAQPQILQLPQGQVLVQPGMFPNQQLNPLQLAQIQAYQAAGLQPPMPGMQGGQGQQLTAQQQQQQRKTLFTPYLPQATLPALLGDGQLVAGILRVNKKNRSDAYVTTTDLDADIFICGSKDRNRALEGDLVAVELLDVDEVWSQKREKEEKKKRKDMGDPRSGSITAVNDATTQPESSAIEGGIRRRGSLKQRPTQKKNDDVEVEGQSLLLVEEDEINDEQKPLYAGHIVAVIERVAGQMFSGTLGLLRPSSQATKERQEAERGGRDNRQQDRQQDRPKIVWFKPTDKRVPLIAIPTEQAPRDFVDKHQDYANKIFVACIKRWPITSLHPFGTLVEQLGDAGDLRVETDALLRDNNFGPDDFSDAVTRSVGFDGWSVAQDGEAALEGRRDFRTEQTFSVDPNGSGELDDAIHFKTLDDGLVEIGFHVADVAHFIKPSSLVDREAKKRGTGVYLVNRSVNMLPARLASDICCLKPGEERYTVSVVFKVNAETGAVSEADTWIGKSIIKSSGKLSYSEVDAAINGGDNVDAGAEIAKQVRSLNAVTQKLRQARFGNRAVDIPALRLMYQLDDENVPVEQNIFNTSPAHEMIEELSHKANAAVAAKLYAAMPDKALLRRQSAPNPRRLQTFAERMTNIGYDVDTSSSGALQDTLFKIEDLELRKGMETLLIKSMNRAKYYVAGKVPQDQYPHFVLNLPIYTHFTNPTRRYADILVHRQLEHVLSNTVAEYTEDIENLAKIAEGCNTKKDSAQAAQEQSVHIESCRMMDRKSQELGGDLISEGIVLCVYESAFDVLIPEYGFEKRVHCDQLPLKKAEFDKNKRLLELYWEKGVPSSAYVPEDERPKGSNRFASSQGSTANSNHSKPTETGTISTEAADALFDDDGESVSELTDQTAGVSLNADRNTQSLPPSPTHHSMSGSRAPQRAKSDSRALHRATAESKISNKERYLKLFKLREEGGEYIQDVTEMTRVPIILKTDLTKSPPCLTIRSVNPYAL
ncbi:RNB-domain-containing protein [Myriangium duriaei CBS 260.36]|uniref:RNB-domain-containing protein n=1 Tax=Myriangium duriaei CBS 260.36 TaxID=1168546 RepID=A0A9P4J1Q7_9PEZI|nr:RNB-domain-containing protein [Myriangium duriaei CBS 260.36]